MAPFLYMQTARHQVNETNDELRQHHLDTRYSWTLYVFFPVSNLSLHLSNSRTTELVEQIIFSLKYQRASRRCVVRTTTRSYENIALR